MDNGSQTNVLGVADTAGAVPGVRSGASHGVLLTHLQSQHIVGWGEKGGSPTHPPPPPWETQIYLISFPNMLKWLRGPVEGSRRVSRNLTNLWVHFVHHHMRDKILILEEEN